MTCTKCGGKTKVIDSRDVSIGRRRRHECLSCQRRFNTMETTIDIYEDLLNMTKDLKQEIVDSLDKHVDDLHKRIADLQEIKESFYYSR